ncbi:hypothetical protein B0H13DRAFT_1867015 [Mycena leptocephala]|nr:hypothetical protein B0H13DRAFT_1867015 [Mycena leptocephala]
MEPDTLRTNINLQLRIMKPKVGLTAPHDLADLKEAVELVLQDTSVAITSWIYAAPSIAQTKEEPDLTAFMTKLVEVLAMNGQNSNQLYPPRNLPPRPDDCNYSIATGRNLRERIQEYHRMNPGDEPRIRPGVETQFIFQFKTIIYSIAAYTFHLLQRVNAECYALEGYSQHKLILKLDLLTGPHGLGRRGVPSNQGHIKIHLKTWLQDVDSDGDICATQREQEITRGTSTNGLTAVSLTENVAVHGSLRIRAAWTTSVQWTEESELTQEIVDVLVEQWDRSGGSMINKTAGSAEGLRILPGSTIL